MEPVRYEPATGTLWVAHIVYALHSLSIVTGVLTVSSIVGAFVFSIPSVVAVVLNYCLRSDAEGTYLETHFAWQIRTFWYAVLAMVLILLFGIPLATVGIGFVLIFLGYFVLGVWVAYRIARGWVKLSRGDGMEI